MASLGRPDRLQTADAGPLRPSDSTGRLPQTFGKIASNLVCQESGYTDGDMRHNAFQKGEVDRKYLI
jgi:hypothetical protein